MKIGYARVSTLEQNLDLQLQALKKAGCEIIFQEKVSGVNWKRQEFSACSTGRGKGTPLLSGN